MSFPVPAGRLAAPAHKVARAVVILLLACAIGLAGPAAACADGDPASDVLLGENVFYPYSPAVSLPLQRQLNALTAAAARARFPIKVALIDSGVDLGILPGLFGHPQSYARFLVQEIRFIYKRGALLVVMPAGYGAVAFPAAAERLVGSLPPPAGRTSDDLARAALRVVPQLAAASGYPIKGAVAAATAPPRGAGGGGLLAPLLLAAAAIVLAGGTLLARTRRIRD